MALLGETSTRFINLPYDELVAAMTTALENLADLLGATSCRAYQVIWVDDAPVRAEPLAMFRRIPPGSGRVTYTRTEIAATLDRGVRGEVIEAPSKAEVPPGLEELARVMEEEDLLSLLAVPVSVEGRVLAGITCEWEEDPGQWDDDDVAMVRLLGETLLAAHERLSASHAVSELLEAEKLARRSAEQAKEELEAIVDRLDHPFIAVDDKFVIRVLNRNAEQIFGASRESLLGSNALESFEALPGRPVYRAAMEAMETRQPQHLEIEHPGYGGHYAVQVYPSSSGVSVLLRNINAQKRREQAAQREREVLRAELMGPPLVGADSGLADAMDIVRRVGPTDAPVLVLGESGVGKELIAREVFLHSKRTGAPFVKLNCAAVSESVAESELFGHERGAFTGAVGQRMGRFEVADGGTLFLDEVGELSLRLQAKLLRALQEGEIQRVGGNQTLRVDVRIIAATNRDLGLAVAEGSFREDLYYRLLVLPIEVPPLRDRLEDIPMLVESMVREHEKTLHRRFSPLSSDAVSRLRAYSWPGNVRELSNVVARAAVLSPGSELIIPPLSLGDHGAPTGRATTSVPRVESDLLEDVERAHIARVLDECKGVIGGKHGAALRLGLPPSTLRSRMAKLGLSPRR